MVFSGQRLAPILPKNIFIGREYWLVVHEDQRHVARVDAICVFLTNLLQGNNNIMMGF